MRNSCKAGGTAKKKYQAGGGTTTPPKKVIMSPAKIAVGPVKPPTAKEKEEAWKKFKAAMEKEVGKAPFPAAPKKQMGGVIANARKKSLTNRYLKANEKYNQAEKKYLNQQEYEIPSFEYDKGTTKEYNFGKPRQNKKINKLNSAVDKNRVIAEDQAKKTLNRDSTRQERYIAERASDAASDKAQAAENKARKINNKVQYKIYRKLNNTGTRNVRLREKLEKVYEKDAKKYQNGGVIPAKPVMTAPMQGRLGNRPVAGGNMAKGGSLKPVNPSANPGLAKLPTAVRNKMGYAKQGGAHPGFKAVQEKIAAKQGISKKAAGAILASSTRKASAKAKAKNPRLKRVK